MVAITKAELKKNYERHLGNITSCPGLPDFMDSFVNLEVTHTFAESNMNLNSHNQKWKLAFVRKSPLPPKDTWTEVPFYTCRAEHGAGIYYIAMQEDSPVSVDAIKSHPFYDFQISSIKIESDETVFIDWKGNYIIGKEDSHEIPSGRTIVRTDKDYSSGEKGQQVMQTSCRNP